MSSTVIPHVSRSTRVSMMHSWATNPSDPAYRMG